MSARGRSPVERRAEEVVERFIGAYNAKDLVTIESTLAEDIRMVHRERDVDVRGRAGVMRMLAASAQGAFPDRRFHSERRRLVDGPVVVVEHTWGATAARDVPGFGRRGESVLMELCTIFTVQGGHITDYTEYG